MADAALRQQDPHRGQPVMRIGEPLGRARAAVIMLHGRGANAGDMLSLAESLGAPRFAYIAPEAAGRSWYPASLLAPPEALEPWLGSALGVLDDLVAEAGRAGVPAHRIVLVGFSQGASLCLTYAASHRRRYGGIVGWSGGLTGADESLGRFEQAPGSLAGTTAFLGASDVDPFVPVGRLERSAAILREAGAEVTLRLYPGMGHTLNDEEIDWLRDLMVGITNPMREAS